MTWKRTLIMLICLTVSLRHTDMEQFLFKMSFEIKDTFFYN